MGQLAWIISIVLSIFVSILNFLDHRYLNGAFMAVVSFLTFIELIKQLRAKAKDQSFR
ncbi:hypothetical protein SAMN05421676_10390 [Salinibacillus kushneri]|uniref:Uncharacterized protein n=1 Tax=Salinibacillus kushneri TaxID=237682 RepID=A0A1I0CA26_9BACI|nr:hypothetical protein [Salinibacillus kushneri]SET16336.1 hypothetical protein SAMN05421676_10390 [Salinibacillus kushneri]